MATGAEKLSGKQNEVSKRALFDTQRSLNSRVNPNTFHIVPTSLASLCSLVTESAFASLQNWKPWNLT
jgi:hypothetical protein